MICHQLGRNELDLSGSEAPGGTRAQQDTWGPITEPGPGTGSSCARARGEPPAPGGHLARPAKLLMSGNGDFSPRLWPRRAIWVLLAPALKSQSTF